MDDIDWENGIIRPPRPKQHRVGTYPLTSIVGDAIIAYLKIRPVCRHRQVFISMLQPYRPLISSGSMGTVVRGRQKALGQQMKRYGPHGLRHACPTYLLTEGFTLKQIGITLVTLWFKPPRFMPRWMWQAWQRWAMSIWASSSSLTPAVSAARAVSRPILCDAMRSFATVRPEGTVMKLLACVNSYVKYRQSLGVGFCGEKGQLHAFVRSVGDIELRTLTPKAVRHYLDGDGPITNYWLSKYHTLTGFYRYAISRKYVSASPLPLDKPRGKDRSSPTFIQLRRWNRSCRQRTRDTAIAGC